MKPLAEAVHILKAGEVLEGRQVLPSKLLQLWVCRRATGFDLYLTCCAEAQALGPGSSFRTTVGRNLLSAEEVLEVLHHLDAFYCIEPKQLLQLPVSFQPATPELIAAIERQFDRNGAGLEAIPQEAEEKIEVVLEEPEEDIQHLLLTDT